MLGVELILLHGCCTPATQGPGHNWVLGDSTFSKDLP